MATQLIDFDTLKRIYFAPVSTVPGIVTLDKNGHVESLRVGGTLCDEKKVTAHDFYPASKRALWDLEQRHTDENLIIVVIDKKAAVITLDQAREYSIKEATFIKENGRWVVDLNAE